jgi:hypothetical protein
MRKVFLITTVLVAFTGHAMARDAVQIPSGTYLEFPNPEGQPLSVDASDGTYGMGRYGSCTIIKKTVKFDSNAVYDFDANCVSTHGDKFLSNEKWKLERGENGDTYLVTVSYARGFVSKQTDIGVWKLMKE